MTFENNLVRPDAEGSPIEQLALGYAEAKADQAELEVVRAYFLLALTKLPDSTLEVSLTEQAQLGELPLQLQARADDSGVVYIRAVAK